MNFHYNSIEKNIQLPHNILIEEAILTEILLNKKNINFIFYKVEKDFFYLERNKYIFEATKYVYEEYSKVNIDIVADYLNNVGFLTKIGGIKTLIDLINKSFPTKDIDVYIILLIDKYIRRQIIKATLKIQKLTYESLDSIESIFDEAESILFSITQKKINGNLLLTSEVLLETFIDLENRSLESSYSGVKSGFFDLDVMTQGFQKSDLVIIAGRPSMGKTAFALNLIRNVADEQSFPVIVFSLEMSRQQLIYRFLSTESQVIHSKLRTGHISGEEWQSISKAIAILANLKIYLDDTPNISLNLIRNKVNTLKIQYGQIRMIVLDYLQLLSIENNKESRVQELSRLTRGLKIMAKEFDTPVLVLSQLSRSVESRTNKRPLLSDLRESGCIDGKTEIYITRRNKYLSVQRLLHKEKNIILSIKKEKRHVVLNNTKIQRIFCTGSRLLYCVNIANSIALKVTANHKLLTLRGWIPLKNLLQKDLIYLVDVYNFSKLSLLSNKSRSRVFPFLFCLLILNVSFYGKKVCYDLWSPKYHNYIGNGLCIHNSIEQDADLVLMLYRESYYEENIENDSDITEIIITKHRNGPIGTVNLVFEPKTIAFSNLIF